MSSSMEMLRPAWVERSGPRPPPTPRPLQRSLLPLLLVSRRDGSPGRQTPPPSASTASSPMVLSNDIRSLMSRSGFKVDSGNGGLSALFWGAGSHRCCRQCAIVVAAIAVVVITAADIIVAALVVDGKLMLPQADGHHRQRSNGVRCFLRSLDKSI